MKLALAILIPLIFTIINNPLAVTLLGHKVTDYNLTVFYFPASEEILKVSILLLIRKHFVTAIIVFVIAEAAGKISLINAVTPGYDKFIIALSIILAANLHLATMSLYAVSVSKLKIFQALMACCFLHIIYNAVTYIDLDIAYLMAICFSISAVIYLMAWIRLSRERAMKADGRMTADC